jgi:hypothetical protein
MKYHTTYKVNAHPEGLEAAEVPDEHGACTALVFASLVYPSDGSFSALVGSMDGRTGEKLPAAEVWKTWTLMAKSLADDPTLSPNKRMLCQQVFDIVREAIMEVKRVASSCPACHAPILSAELPERCANCGVKFFTKEDT